MKPYEKGFGDGQRGRQRHRVSGVASGEDQVATFEEPPHESQCFAASAFDDETDHEPDSANRAYPGPHNLRLECGAKAGPHFPRTFTEISVANGIECGEGRSAGEGQRRTGKCVAV